MSRADAMAVQLTNAAPALRAAHRGNSRGLSLVELLVVIAIIGVLLMLLLPSVQQARTMARAINCQSNLRQMGLALQQFEATNGCLPIVKSSVWTNGYMPADEVWSGGAFTPYIEDSEAVPWCPEDPHPKLSSTSYAFVFSTGKGICSQQFQRTVPQWVISYMGGGDHVPPQHTAFGINIDLPLARVTDGLSKTVAFGEIRMGDDRSDKHKNAIYSHFRLPNCLEPDVTRGTIEPAIAPVVEGDKKYCITQFNTARSYHQGGVYTVHLDGHCEFVSNDVEPDIWHESATINGYVRE